MQQVAQPWVILSLSQSSFLVGLDSFALNAPGLIFTLWGGILADRMDRKRIILVFQAIQFLCVLVLFTLLVTKHLHIWMIIVISFLVGTTDSLSMPAFQSIIPSLVKQKDIHRAVALGSTQFNLSRMLGPAIAGVMMGTFGAVACFGANAFSYIPFFISLYWIYPKRGVEVRKASLPQHPTPHQKEFKKLLLGPGVRAPLMTIFVTSFFCSPLLTFCPVLIKDVFHAEVGDFGGAMAAFGFGGLIGAGASLISLPPALDRGRIATAVGILLGLIVVAIAFNRSLPILTLMMIFAGVALTMSNISGATFLQENASSLTRGKIVSLFQLALQGGIAAGGLLTGFTISQFGISTALIINGSAAMALQISILILSRRSILA
jgi:predicted MFS family arabinose efflux permease